MKKVKVIIGALLLITAIAAGIYVAFGDFEPEDSSAGIDKSRRDLVSTISYNKGESLPSFIEDMLPDEGVLDYFVLSFTDKQGIPVQRITGDELMTVKTIAVPKLSTTELTDTIELPVVMSDVMATEYVVWSGSDAKPAENIGYQNLVMFSANRDVIVGNYFSINGNYNIEYAGQGQYLFYREEAKLGLKDEVIEIDKDDLFKEQMLDGAVLPSTSEFDPTGSGPYVIDLMVVYTENALAESGGNETLLRARSVLGVAQTNTALLHSPPLNDPSNITIVSITHFMKIAYSESGQCSTDADRLVALNDGYMDTVHTARASNGADVVALLIYLDSRYEAQGCSFISNQAQHAFAVIDQAFVDRANYPALAHELGHIFGADHFYDPDRPPSPMGPKSHAYALSFPGTTTREISVVGNTTEQDDLFRLVYSTPYFLVLRNGVTYPFGTEDREYNASIIAERVFYVSAYNTIPNGGGGYIPPGPVSYLCDVWRVTCNDNQKFLESSCDTQRNFNNTWHNTWPGGGLGRWQHEACLSHGGPSLSNCPNVQQDPIKWCVTLDCPNGDTNGDSRCTTADQGANTQASNNSAFCPYPQSGQGDINIYSGDSTQINFQTYCGTTYKYLVSSNPNISCNPDNVIMSVNPNPAQIGQGVTFSLAGSTEGDTWVEDYWSGGFNCSGNVTPGQTKTCTAAANGTYTWTHKWKKCEGSSTNCSNLCTKTSTFVVSNPIPTATPTPVVVAPSTASGIEVKKVSNGVEVKQVFPDVPSATRFYVERCQGATCTNFSQIGHITVPGVLYTDTSAVNTQIYRYRIRGWNSGGYGPYSVVRTPSVTWTFTTKAVCANGATPSGVGYPVRLQHALWPPNPFAWQVKIGTANQVVLTMTSQDSSSTAYLYLADRARLVPTGTPPHSAISYTTALGGPLAKIDRNALPAGNYTINYAATAANCQ